MMRQAHRPIKIVLFLAVTTVALFFAGAFGWKVLAEQARENPHEIQSKTVQDELCGSCHRQEPKNIPQRATRTVLPKQDDYKEDPVAMCVSCHEQAGEEHPVGAKPEYPVPADLPLDKEGKVSCLTCHFTHGSLKSDHACCSTSFLDRFFAKERKFKSFLLRRENTKGELCKACHQSSGRKKEK